MLNISFDLGLVSMDWRGACIVPLNQRNGGCMNACKLYGRLLIKRVRAGTEYAIGEEQCGIRQCRDYF